MPGESQRVRPSWVSSNPRSSSTQSLVPSESEEPGRRTLLLIYIHGFLGNESSFQSFPAHIHNLLKVTLAETHVIHTKIYPRYKSRKVIEFVRDEFSTWLSPHESETTDVILLGHSMGGILAAEVVLLQPHLPADGHSLRHRVIGTVNFDTPFLGMHPGVIVSGIGSLFRPSPAPNQLRGHLEGDESSSSSEWPSDHPGTPLPLPTSTGTSAPVSSSTHFHFTPTSTLPTVASTGALYTTIGDTGPQPSPTPLDPNYNPPFLNDVQLSNRSNWEAALHFVLKYSGSLPIATKTYIMSHLEFGSCLADYGGLKSRYAKIRQLEDVDDISNVRVAQPHNDRRVRFINYYTASTGRQKVSNTLGTRTAQDIDIDGQDMSNLEGELARTESSSSPRISARVHQDPDKVNGKVGETPGPTQDNALHQDAGMNNGGSPSPGGGLRGPDSVLGASSTLPPVPLAPGERPLFDASQYADKSVRKLAEKEHARAVKAYKQAVKDHSRSIKDRNKLIEKLEKKAKQERERGLKVAEKGHVEKEKEERLRLSGTQFSSAEANKRSPRDKKFCTLPPDIAGRPDPTWVRVFMEGVDEVGAHCGLFMIGQAYERLVGDVGTRIEGWVREEETRRAIRQIEEPNNY